MMIVKNVPQVGGDYLFEEKLDDGSFQFSLQVGDKEVVVSRQPKWRVNETIRLNGQKVTIKSVHVVKVVALKRTKRRDKGYAFIYKTKERV